MLHVHRDLTKEQLPDECVGDCSASGDVSESVTYWRDRLNFTVDRGRAMDYLESSGGWDREDLDKETDTWLAMRVLWLACCQFKEGDDYFYLGE